jgi:hypothetical protein
MLEHLLGHCRWQTVRRRQQNVSVAETCPSSVLTRFSLGNWNTMTDAIGAVGADETAETLWGADKSDPKDALAANGFKMKSVVLTRPPGSNRGPRRGARKPRE